MSEAFNGARLSEAAQMYDEHHHDASVEMALLRARIHLKKAEYGQAINFLSGDHFLDLKRAPDAERSMLLAIAYSRSNRFSEADESFARAEAAGKELVATGELAYWRGRRFLEERRPKDAREQLKRVRKKSSDEARILADLLESGILTQEERYLDGALLLMHLLEFMDGLKDEHVEAEIWALHTVATRARELNAVKLRRFVQSRVSRQQWTEDFRVNQFQTYKAVAWCHALEGDFFNAFRYLKMAGAIAPSTAWHAMTLLDRAYLASCVGEALWSRSEFFEAKELMDSVNWRETQDEERVALLLAAELSVSHSAGQASAYLATFFSLRDSLNPQLHLRYDDRLTAQAEYANGVVQSHLGNRESATRSLEQAWTLYDAIGYDWRAGRCALRLLEIKRDDVWLERAREKLQGYPHSWLARELRQRGDAGAERLAPRQRQIYELLVEGKSTAEIARITERSRFTVQNQIKTVLRAFGVASRSELLAEVMRRRSVSH